jgi:general nucleoside transport system ATP-binding protein
LDEILSLSDRVVVLYEGRSMGEVPGGQATCAQIGLMMAGTPNEGGANG